MILMLGLRSIFTILNVVDFTCAVCGMFAHQNVEKRSRRLTVFFIPLLPVSTTYVNQCTYCGAETRLTREQAHHSLRWRAAHD